MPFIVWKCSYQAKDGLVAGRYTNTSKPKKDTETKETEKRPSTITVFPNPVKNTLTVRYSLNTQGNVRMRVLSSGLQNILITGNSILKSKGLHTEQIDVSKLSSGIYFLELEKDSKKEIIKFIVNKN